ncbi:MAG: phosphatase PAP2 family protein [Phaeodactylibacter sp.]|nr:phosphatase PAP2 family protein [Phaeodactylibacter sp.]MCB9303009.1 phosphatase PAP2 family protein [Lewinellaceae bacterium]
MPAFFQYLQQRPGLVLNDFLLTVLPARDLSKFIFGLIYFSLAYIILRGVYSPVILLHFLIGYVVVLAVRVITLSLSPLEPPLGLVPLTDPGALFFYGGIEVTKDLFFSGHTATAFLIYLCLQERIEKAVALAAVIVLAVMLLIQHIHYTIDVLAAVPITYYCYQLSKRIAAYALG